MAYIPVAKRKLGTAVAAYTPVAERSAAPGLTAPNVFTPTAQSTSPTEVAPGAGFVQGIPDDIFQGSARAGGTLVETGKQLVSGQQEQVVPQGPIQRAVFGKDPVNSLQINIAETQKGLEKEGIPKPIAGPYGAFTAVGSLALDLSPAGGEKNALSAIAKVKDITEAAKIARTIGVEEDLIQDAARAFVQAQTPEHARAAVDAIEKLQRTTKAYTPVAARSSVAPEKAAGDYFSRVILPAQEAGKPTVISADNIKDLYKDYNDANHPTYSKAAFQLYEDALKQNPNEGVIFTAGGPGSGKTELLVNTIDKAGFDGIIYDSNMSNLEGAKRQIEAARSAGKNVNVYALLPDLEQSRNFTLARAERTGRAISDKTFARSHASVPNTLRTLLEDGTLKPEEVRLFDMRDKPSLPDAIGRVVRGEFAEDPLAVLQKVRYDEKELQELYGQETRRIEGSGRVPQEPGGGLSRNQGDDRGGAAGGSASDRRAADGGDHQGDGGPEGKPANSGVGPLSEEEKQAEKLAYEKRNEGRPAARNAAALSPEAEAAFNGPGIIKAKAEIEDLKVEKDIGEDAAANAPGRGLAKHESRTTGELPEVTGKDTRKSLTGSGRDVPNSAFGKKGDVIAQEMGFDTAEEAQKALDDYKDLRARAKQTRQQISARVKNYRDRKAVFDELKRFVTRQGQARRERIAAVEDFFNLDAKDMKALLKGERDVRLMTDGEFADFMKRLEGKATEQYLASQVRLDLMSTIFEKEFVKLDNLQKALKLPTIQNMKPGQMRRFDELLQTFEKGDEFLGPRQIQTLKNTDIKGIHTMREAHENLLKDVNAQRARMNLPPATLEDLKNVKVGWFDKFRYDPALARQNPLYETMVRETHKAALGAEANVFRIKDKVDDLMRAARNSRKRGFLDRAIPTDHKIFDWLEANDAEKIKMSADMTREELDAAVYIRDWYASARDYLVQHEVLKKFRSDYITHVRRGFLEAWKEGASSVAGVVSGEKKAGVERAGSGLLAAFKESFSQYKLDAAYFNILDQKTDTVLPLEKFFQFSMKRTGELTPTQNVSKAFLKYVSTFEKKRMLDSIVPKLDVYVHSLTPKKLTPKGLEFDDSLKRFFKQWMNTKKGRPTDLGFLKPGDPLDWGMRTGVALTRLLDLGLSLPVGIASNVGAQLAVYRGLGEKGYALGKIRAAMPQGREIVKKYKNFVGESVLEKMRSTESTLGDSLAEGVFGLFSFADRKARQTFLLGSMTPEEFKAGVISADRLTDMKLALGRQLPIEGSDSIIGKTGLGKVFSQYKSWAIPLLSSTADDLEKLYTAVKAGDAGYVKTPEFAELMRTALVSTAVGVFGYGLLSDKMPMKDRTFADKLAVKAAQDALSFVGVLDPTLWTATPRLLQFIYDLSTALKQIVLIQKDKDGNLSGVKKLEITVTPGIVKQVLPPGKEKKGASGVAGLPQFPKLPKNSLPKFPKLPKNSLPKFPSL